MHLRYVPCGCQPSCLHLCHDHSLIILPNVTRLTCCCRRRCQPCCQLSLEERRLLLVAALLLPLRQLSYPAKGNKQAPASSYVIRDSIKWRNKDVEGVALLHAQVAELASVHKELAAAGESTARLVVHVTCCTVLRSSLGRIMSVVVCLGWLLGASGTQSKAWLCIAGNSGILFGALPYSPCSIAEHRHYV